MTNINIDQINQAKSLLEGAKDILMATHSQPTIDSIAASLAIYLALSKNTKQTTIVCPDEMTVEFSKLVGVNKIRNNLTYSTGNILKIFFPYQEGSIEKVSYNIDDKDNIFNLIIEHGEKFPKITPDKVKFSYEESNVDLIITVDCPKLEDLNHVYSNNQKIFSQSPIINIDSHSNNNQYGQINIVDEQTSSTSEIAFKFLSNLGLTIDADIATNLLLGISWASGNFTSEKTSAFTFETAAICLKNGASKSVLAPKTSAPSVSSSQKITSQAYIPISFSKSPKATFKTSTISSKSATEQKNNELQKSETNVTPDDWLKPKIYKGSTLL